MADDSSSSDGGVNHSCVGVAHANNIKQSSSDDLHEIEGAGLRAYQFEPRRETSDEEGSQGTSDAESDTSTNDEDGRLNRIDYWCRCGHCSTELLVREKECICCKETKYTSRLAGNIDCVTNNPDFEVVCQTPIVLRNLLVGLNNVRADHWDTDPTNNRGLRYAVYRQFTWWAHGKLGKGRRRVIPACVTHNIRTLFPKDEREEHTGYMSGQESG